MVGASPSHPSSIARRDGKLATMIEGLEPRLYLSEVAFGPPVITSAASATTSPVYAELGHVYGLGYADLVTANSPPRSNGSVSILPGKGDGTFGTATTIPLNFSPLTIRTGVLTQNALTDIVVGSPNSDQFCVIEQSPAGHFTPYYFTLPELTDTQSVAIGNFGGSLPGVAVASIDPGTASDNVAVFLNNTQPGQNISLQSPQIFSVPHADLASITTYTAGGVSDLAVADSADNDVTTLINNGSGTFSLGADYSIGQGNTGPVTITDGEFNLNTNTNDDLVTANLTSGTLSVLLGNGDGTFSGVKTTPVAGAVSGGGPLDVRLANLNADYLPDLILLLTYGSSGDAEALLGGGDGTFHLGNIVNTGSGPYTGIAAGDLNDDLLTDMVLSNAKGVTSLMNIANSTGNPTGNSTGPFASMYGPQPSVAAGAPTLDFAVTYQDTEDVDTSTLGGANVTVIGPFGNTLAATLVSTDRFAGNFVTVTYGIPAQSNSASPADDGVYKVIATSNAAGAVKDVIGLALQGGPIGQFTVMLPFENPNEANLVAKVVRVNNPTTAFSDARFTGATRVTIVNSGNARAKGKIVIDLYASPGHDIPIGIEPLTSVTRSIDLKPGGKVVEVLPGFYWPGTVGINFIVADVDATQTLAETTYGDNFCTSVRSTGVAIPIVNIQNLWNAKIPVLKAGKKTAIPLLIRNVGDVAAKGTATVTVLGSPDGLVGDATTLATVPVGVNVGAGKKQTLNVKFTDPSIASGTYQMIVAVTFPASTGTADTAVVSPGTFTV